MNQNILLSLLIIAVLLPLAITGILCRAAVVLVREVAEVVVVINGLRAARTHTPSQRPTQIHQHSTGRRVDDGMVKIGADGPSFGSSRRVARLMVQAQVSCSVEAEDHSRQDIRATGHGKASADRFRPTRGQAQTGPSDQERNRVTPIPRWARMGGMAHLRGPTPVASPDDGFVVCRLRAPFDATPRLKS